MNPSKTPKFVDTVNAEARTPRILSSDISVTSSGSITYDVAPARPKRKRATQRHCIFSAKITSTQPNCNLKKLVFAQNKSVTWWEGKWDIFLLSETKIVQRKSGIYFIEKKSGIKLAERSTEIKSPWGEREESLLSSQYNGSFEKWLIIPVFLTAISISLFFTIIYCFSA